MVWESIRQNTNIHQYSTTNDGLNWFNIHQYSSIFAKLHHILCVSICHVLWENLVLAILTVS